MGGRIGCHLALEEKVSGLICLGYPLCAMGDRTKLRDQVLRSLGTPILLSREHGIRCVRSICSRKARGDDRT